MTKPSPEDTALGGPRRDFPSTCWSRFIGDVPTSEAHRESAATELATRYWKPIYGYVRATWAKSNEDAKDLTQDFFVWMLESGFVSRADPARGRFRGFVKTALNHYLSDERRRDRSQKRGGDRTLLTLDASDPLPALQLPDPAGRTPEQILDDAWKDELLSRAESMLRDTLHREGRESAFEVFRDYYLSEAEDLDYRQAAAKYGVAEGEILNRLRTAKKRYLAILKGLVAESVGGEAELAEEWNALFGTIGT